jgi:TonB family protein
MNILCTKPRSQPAPPKRGRFLGALLASSAVHAVLLAASGGGLLALGAGSGARERNAVLLIEPPVVESFELEPPPREITTTPETDLDVEPAATPSPAHSLELAERLRKSAAAASGEDLALAVAGWRLSLMRPGQAGVAASLSVSPPAEAPAAGSPRIARASPGAAPASTRPRLVSAPQPRYPSAAVRANEEGTVLCRLHVSATGDVVEVEIVASSGHERLDRAAREALLRWRFEPSLENGRPVSSTLLHPVEFVLTDG